MPKSSVARKLVCILPLLLTSYLVCDTTTELQKAQDLLAKGSLPEAVVALKHVVESDPTNVDAHLVLGTALALQGLRSESLKETEMAIYLAPNSAKTHNQLGVVLSRFLETVEAKKAFEDAISLDPSFAEAHVNLALALAQTDELALAHEQLDKAIVLYGATAPAAKPYFIRAKVWSAQGDNDHAIADLEKAINLNPGYAEAWFDLSQLRQSKGNLDGAIAAAQKAVDLNPNDGAEQSWLGRTYLEKGDAARAVRHLKTARTLGADDKPTLYSLARALRASGKTEESKQVEDQVIALQSRSTTAGTVLFTASGLNEEGLKLERAGDLNGALEKYQRAIDLDPTGFGFRLNYALALCRTGRWQDGIVELKEVLKEDPDNADAAKALFIAQEEVAKKK